MPSFSVYRKEGVIYESAAIDAGRRGAPMPKPLPALVYVGDVWVDLDDLEEPSAEEVIGQLPTDLPTGDYVYVRAEAFHEAAVTRQLIVVEKTTTPRKRPARVKAKQPAKPQAKRSRARR